MKLAVMSSDSDRETVWLTEVLKELLSETVMVEDFDMDTSTVPVRESDTALPLRTLFDFEAVFSSDSDFDALVVLVVVNVYVPVCVRVPWAPLWRVRVAEMSFVPDKALAVLDIDEDPETEVDTDTVTVRLRVAVTSEVAEGVPLVSVCVHVDVTVAVGVGRIVSVSVISSDHDCEAEREGLVLPEPLTDGDMVIGNVDEPVTSAVNVTV